jgi:hypothetical protein
MRRGTALVHTIADNASVHLGILLKVSKHVSRRFAACREYSRRVLRPSA